MLIFIVPCPMGYLGRSKVFLIFLGHDRFLHPLVLGQPLIHQTAFTRRSPPNQLTKLPFMIHFPLYKLTKLSFISGDRSIKYLDVIIIYQIKNIKNFVKGFKWLLVYAFYLYICGSHRSF